MSINKKLDVINTKLDKLIDYAEVSEYSSEVLQLTLNEWLKQWIELYKVNKVKAGTLYQQNLLIKNHISNQIGNIPIDKIDGITIQKFLIKIKAPRQRERIFGVLRDSLTRAYSLQLISFNPTLAVQIPKHTKRLSRAFDLEQQARFIEACKTSRYGDMYLIMLFTGLRKGEAMALYESDIDLKNNLISVTKTINELNQIDTPKTKTSIRQIPIFEPLKPIVSKYISNSRKRLFPLNESNSHKYYVKILEKCGLDKQGFTTHSLRHTFITRCIENDVPVKVIQKWAGHSTADMTLNVYAHINNDFEIQAIKDLNARLEDNLKKQ